MNWIVAKIKSIRQSLGYSQLYMAEKIGVDIRTYGNWERGTNEINLTNLKKIADVLNVDIKEIWDETKWVRKPYKRSEDEDKAEEPITPYKNEMKKLEREVEILKEQNLALTRALNELFEQKKSKLQTV